MYDLSIVVPVYNASEFIGAFIHELVHTLGLLPINAEIILVDDCSTDDTFQVCSKVLADLAIPSSIYALVKNSGQYYATIAGLDKATGKLLLTIDCDFAPPPSLIGKIWGQLKMYPGSITYLEFNRSRSMIRKIGTVGFNALIRMQTGKNLDSREGSSFRIFDKELFETTRQMIVEPSRLDILLMRNANKIYFLEDREIMVANLSKHGIKKLFRYYISLLKSSTSDILTKKKTLDTSHRIKSLFHHGR